MGNIVFFVVMNLFAIVTTKASNPRSVNVALETSFLFQPGEENSFINKVRSFIDQIEQAITPVKSFLRTTDDKNKPKIFSKFIQKITRNIMKYNDDDLEEVAKLLANEAENVLNTIEALNENTKRAIVMILKEYSRANADQIRENLQNALNGNEILITKLAEKFDGYYCDNDKAKLDKLIDKSDKFAEEKSEYDKTDIKTMVKDFVNILKDKYDTLDETVKAQINRYFGNILQYIDLSKIFLNDRHAETKHADLTKKGNFKHIKEIIVNKSIEIFVKSPKNGTENVKEKNHSKETHSEKNHSKEDLEINTLDNQSEYLSTVLNVFEEKH